MAEGTASGSARFWGDEYPEDAVPAELADTEPEWVGIRFLRDKGDFDPESDCLDFEYRFDDDDAPQDGWGRYLWLYAEDHGNPENVGWLVRKFLKQFSPDKWWALSYATTCSKPHVGEFGGGAIFVTADEIKWQNTADFISQEQTAFKARKRRVPVKKREKKTP